MTRHSSKRRKRKTHRGRIGQVSYYRHHGAWYIYYREGRRQVRRRVADNGETAAQVAAQVNAQLAVSAPTCFSFAPLGVAELRRRFLDYHEHVQRSSLATVRRYRAATQHLENYAQRCSRSELAHQINAEDFARYLRSLQIAPNGHPHAARRRLRDKGVRFILETCRAMYGYAARRRHLPPYGDNPFAGLGGKRSNWEDAKPIFVFDRESELAFFQAADDWSFPIHFVLAKTGLRPGELVHLLIEDADLDGGWLQIRDKPQLGWRIKTRRQRAVPLHTTVLAVLRRVIAERTAGPVFPRCNFDPSVSPLANHSAAAMEAACRRRVAAEEARSTQSLSREQQARIARGVWRDAGAIKSDHVRKTFMHITRATGLAHATCPKSWRHTFATLLQDANVDPLIRQITLGHAPAVGQEGALGMTSLYTHTRPETQRREILRALEIWPRSLEWAGRWAAGHSSQEE